jgi:hypothetical protein
MCELPLEGSKRRPSLPRPPPAARSYFVLDLAAPVVALTLAAAAVGCYETGLQVRCLLKPSPPPACRPLAAGAATGAARLPPS